MSRPKSTIQIAAMEQLAKHLESGADVALVRVMFPTVAAATWYRWVDQARAIFAAGGGRPPPKDKRLPPAKPGRGPKPKPKKAKRAKPGRPPKSEQKTPPAPPTDPDKLATKEAAKASRRALVPAEHQDQPYRPSPEGGGSGGALRIDPDTDGETYEVMTMFGVKETSVITHFVDRTKPGVPDPVAIMERVSDQFTHAEALMRSAIKRVGTGHAIIDPQAFAAGVDLQLKSMKLLHGVMKDARNLDSVQRFVGAVTDLLRREDPAFARKVSQLLREAGRVFLSTSPQGAG